MTSVMNCFCCVYECSESANSQYDETSTLFHPFPLESQSRLTEWCQLLLIDPVSNLSGLFVCGKHFSPQQYDYSTDSKKPLKADAVPDRYLPKIARESKSSSLRRNVEDRFNPPVLVVDDLGKVCRLCLETDEQATHESLTTKGEIVEFIGQSIGIEIQSDDGYPQMICQTCIDRVTYIHRSREWFHKNDQFLKALIEEWSCVADEPLRKSSEEEADMPSGDSTKFETEDLLFDSGSIEGKEITLEEMGVTPSETNDPSSDDEPLLRKRRKRRCAKKTLKKSSTVPKNRPPAVKSMPMLERTNGKYLCNCELSYSLFGRHRKNKMEKHCVHDQEVSESGVVPPNPSILEEMAAVFNRV